MAHWFILKDKNISSVFKYFKLEKNKRKNLYFLKKYMLLSRLFMFNSKGKDVFKS